MLLLTDIPHINSLKEYDMDFVELCLQFNKRTSIY